jgi:ParB family chromosome partitioning protein
MGLPETVRMRHDTHFVDQLVRPSGEPVGRMVAITDLDPNPNQPRQTIGDLSELTTSIREKGVLEPILVRRTGTRFQIIAGERRYRAAMEAGLAEVPCIVRDASEAEMMELALIENLQREDLSPFEEADGLRALAEKHAYTHEKIADVLGRSRTSITETLALANMPEEIRQLCRLADIDSKSLLLQIVRQASPGKMAALIDRLQKEGTTRSTARAIVREQKPKSKGRPRHYVFRYAAPSKTFSLALEFKKSQVPRDEIVRVLQEIIEELTREES